MKRSVTIGGLGALVLLTVVAFGQNRPSRFEPLSSGKCFPLVGNGSPDFRIECGYLIVPEIRGRNGARDLRLAVAILHPVDKATAPPLVMLHGGPGGSGLLTYTRSVLASPLARSRDIVIYDQRASGLSEPKLCPEIDEQANVIRNLASPDERARRREANDRRCVADLKALGADPAAYTTEANTSDLIDLRQALGYSTWDIYGESYGGRLAQEIMRRDPKGVHAVVLASPAIPGPTTWAESALSQQRWVEHIFAACAAESSCQSAFPQLENDFYAVYDELNASPIPVPVDTRVSTTGTVLLNGNRFLADLGGPPERVARIPMLINELRRGNKLRAAKELVGSGAMNGGNNRALRNLIICYDTYGSDFKKAVDMTLDKLKAPFRQTVNEAEQCPRWQEHFADTASYQFVRSDIPTLILSAEFDDRTPTEHAKRIAAGFKKVYLYELANEVHGQRPEGCHRSILTQFLENPDREPDASCIAKVVPMKFQTTWSERATVLLTINSVDNAKSKFVGQWNLYFPGALGAMIDAKIDGQKVIGTIYAGPNSSTLDDGRIEGDTISFKSTSFNGDRTVTFSGKLDGDEIAFSRTVDIRPGGAPGGLGIFGALAVKEFTAKRTR